RNRTDRSAAWKGLVPTFDTMPLLDPHWRHLTIHNAIATAEWFGLPGAAQIFASTPAAVHTSTGDPMVQLDALLHRARANLERDRFSEAQVLLVRASSRVVAITEDSMREQFATEIDVMTADVLAETDPAGAHAAYDRVVEEFTPAERPLRRSLMLLERGRLFA